MVTTPVKRAAYVPERGDIVWLSFAPQAGHEQAGKRPALVLSPKAYNEKVGLALFCPVTTKIKAYPFEVVLPSKGLVSGAILCDQVRSFDWRARKAKFVERVAAGALQEALAKVRALLF